MAAVRAHQPTRRIRLQPALVLPPVPDAVFWSEHPPMALAVEDCEVAHGEPERARRHAGVPSLIDERAISRLSLGEGVHSHWLTVSGGEIPRV
jgi:hypothetical protein